MDEMTITEERITETVAALSFYDPREVLSWDAEGKITFTASADIPLRAILPIREIACLPQGGLRVRFHEDLARMPPEEQHRRVAELLEFAASLKVPPTIDMEPTEEE